MKNTIQQAERNERNLTVTFSGYGHWKISCTYRGKEIKAVTTNSMAVDDFKSSEQGEKDGRQSRRLRGYNTLISEIIRANQ
jgi:hypothetical protein